MKRISGKTYHRLRACLRTYKVWVFFCGLALFAMWFWGSLPAPLFKDPTSVVLEDRKGNMLGAVIAGDEQWRFPYNPSVPEKFRLAITNHEDKRFFKHWGIDPIALARAIVQNIKAKRVVSGASTLTMQTIRLSRKGKPRTFREKIFEAILATRLECSYSKNEILALYASHAPFGGNVVGLDAAAWRYFGRSPHQLSWGEIATLAVLPNNPGLVHPGRNRDTLRAKRDRLLKLLKERGVIDRLSSELAMAEPLPGKPLPLPSLAPHLLYHVYMSNKQGDKPDTNRILSTLDLAVQVRSTQILNRHQEKLIDNGIYNAAALIIENETGNVVAYIGNSGSYTAGQHGYAVDMIQAPRSTGSILKPLLFAAMLQDGRILPQTLLRDIPTRFGSFSPKNFNNQFEGAVPADQALYRSLNVPFVYMLHDYGTHRFRHLLQKAGITTLTKDASHYGLSLVLGGAEASLWDIAGIYSAMARTLVHFNQTSGSYFKEGFKPPGFEINPPGSVRTMTEMQQQPVFSAAAIWHTMDALAKVNRPKSQGLWQYFSSSRKIAWKTGTSFGFRDAWAIGLTPAFTVAVWVGNADGEGRPGLTGVSKAAPIMFELFNILDSNGIWFEMPVQEMVQLEICTLSGHLAKDTCKSRKTMWVIKSGTNTIPCPYHELIHLDPTETWRVHSDCFSPREMMHKSWFVLPTVQEFYYKKRHANYLSMPKYSFKCLESVYGTNESVMKMIYPKSSIRIHIPVKLDGNLGSAVFRVAHRNNKKLIYWHLDDVYLGSTRIFHQMEVRPDAGPHQLVLMDEDGEILQQTFGVAARR